MNIINKYSKGIFPNVVGIISYDKIGHDRFGNIICDVRAIHRLDIPDPKLLDIKWGKRCDGAEIGGYWILLYGYENCKRMMESFLRDCKSRLERAGATGIEVYLKENFK